MRATLCLSVAFLAVSFGFASPQSANENKIGSVSGRVVDGVGSPIVGAKVYDEPLGSVRVGKDHYELTDQNGVFLIRDVPEGKTMIVATKVDGGYPDARFAATKTGPFEKPKCACASMANWRIKQRMASSCG